MNRHDTSTWILLMINAAAIVCLSIAALIVHYTTTAPSPLRQVPNAHIARPSGANEEPTSGSAARAPVVGTGTARATVNEAPVYGSAGGSPTPHEIQEIVDLRAALGWKSGEVERLTRALAECQRKEGANGKDKGALPCVDSRAQSHVMRHVFIIQCDREQARRDLQEVPSQTRAQATPTGGDANVTDARNQRRPIGDPKVTQPPIQIAPGGGRTKEATWTKSKPSSTITRPDVSNQSVPVPSAIAQLPFLIQPSSALPAPAIYTTTEGGGSSPPTTTFLTTTERPSALALTRSGLPPWSGPFDDFKGDWDAPPVPQPVVSPRMMAVMAIRRPSNPPEPTLPILCDEGDVHGRWGTEYFSQFPNHEYLADKCWLLHAWKREGGDLHCFLAIHGYPSPGCVYDLRLPWEAYAGEHYWGTHWLGVCTSLAGCQWIPVDAENRLGITVQVPMDLPFEQPALLRSARGAMVGGGR